MLNGYECLQQERYMWEQMAIDSRFGSDRWKKCWKRVDEIDAELAKYPVMIQIRSLKDSDEAVW